MAADTQPPGERPDLHDPEVRASLDRYWIRNVRVMATLTVVWLAVGVGCSVLLADVFNQFRLPGTGYPLGFWFAQQGSILCFLVIILVYCVLMNRLDAKHHAELERLRNKRRGGA